MDETLVQKLVEQGRGMSLFKLLDYSCSLSPIGGEPQQYLDYFRQLQEVADKHWQDAIDWSGGLCTLLEGHVEKGRETIPDDVVEAYARLRIYRHTLELL